MTCQNLMSFEVIKKSLLDGIKIELSNTLGIHRENELYHIIYVHTYFRSNN